MRRQLATTSRSRLLAAAFVLLLLIPAGLLYNPASTTSQVNNPTPTMSPGIFSDTQTYGTGLSGAPVVLDEATLDGMTGGLETLSAFESVIERYLQPISVNLVFVDIGWGGGANSSKGFVAGGYHQWVAKWLKASDLFGINNIFFTKQWGYFFSKPSFDSDFLSAYPAAQTVNGSGEVVPLTNCAGCQSTSAWSIVTPNGNYVYKQLEMDLKQLVRWYGNYSNWIGIGEGATGDNNYYGSIGSAIRGSRPFDNYSISVFANSVFFERNIDNASGNYNGGAWSDIWRMFVQDRPDIIAGTGVPLIFPAWQQVYGSTLHRLAARFFIPFGTTLTGFSLKAWIERVGNPPGLLRELVYADRNETVTNPAWDGNPNLLLANASVTSPIGTTGAWVNTTFPTVTLAGGEYYWVVFQANGGDSNNLYQVDYDLQRVYPDVPAGIGGSVLWIQDLVAKNITVYPYLNQGPNSRGNPMYFEVTSRAIANMIAFFDSDRAYDPYNITFSLQYPNGTTLATGVWSSIASSGVNSLNWVPYQLSRTVILEPGVRYQIVSSRPPSGDCYGSWLCGGVTQDFVSETANPCSAGYMGQCRWTLFQVGLMDLEPKGISNLDYLGQTGLQYSPGYTPGLETAIRFRTGSSPENALAFSINVVSTSSDTSGVLNVTLRGDNATRASHPYPIQQSIDCGIVSLAWIAANLKPSQSPFTGHYEWANVTFARRATLSPNTYYWIVLNVTNSQKEDSVGLARLVNPYKNEVLNGVFRSSDHKDFQANWGPPSDGPTDLAYKFVTSVDVFNNEIQYTKNYALRPNTWLAQSFSSVSSFQLKGLWLPNNPGSVQVRTDSGFDAPSGNVLVSATIFTPFMRDPHSTTVRTNSAMQYYQLSVPINVTAGTKYWIVEGQSGRVGVDVYRSDMIPSTYGRGSLHYLVTTNNGSTWSVPNNDVGDMPFILAASTTTIHTYNTKALFSDIKAHVPSDWNIFLNYNQAIIMSNLTRLMAGFGKPNFVWYTGLPTTIITSVSGINMTDIVSAGLGAGGPIGCPPSSPRCGGVAGYWGGDATEKVNTILSSQNQNNVLGWSSFGSTGDNVGGLTPWDTRQMYLLELPWMARNPVTFNDWCFGLGCHGLNNFTQTQFMRSFGIILNRMSYTGGYFGTSKDSVRVLWIETADDGVFPSYLTPATYVTEVSNRDSNLTNFGDLRQFNVIVNPQNVISMTASLKLRLAAYVKDGGGIVETTPPAPGRQDNFLGLAAGSTAVGTSPSLSIVSPNRITSPFSSISYTPYWIRNRLSLLGNESTAVLVQDSRGNPVITANDYFSGRGVFLEQPYARLQYADGNTGFMGDSFATLMINAVFYAAHRDNLLPIIWESSYSSQQPWKSVIFTVDGEPGAPLLWLSTNSSTGSSFDIHLNATFYGVSLSGWLALDARDMTVVASGSGSDIHIAVQIPPTTWLPIYLISRPQNLQPVYSTAGAEAITIGGGMARFILKGSYNASNWLVLSSIVPPSSVSIGTGGGQLQAYPTSSAMNSSRIGLYCTSIGAGGACESFAYFNQQGWYYDPSSSLLYIHYLAAGDVTISVSEPQSTSTSITTSSFSTTTGFSTSSTTSAISITQTTSTQPTASATTSSTSSTRSSESMIPSMGLGYLILFVAICVAAVPLILMARSRFRNEPGPRAP